jgi:hypothetical protein
MCLIEKEAADQQDGCDPNAAIADDIFLVLFKKGDGEPDFLGELIGL